MADELALYLQLTPAFGGTRFGPFEGVEVNLGSDPSCDIVIPEAFGVAPFHAKVLRQEGMGLIIAPVERTAAILVWKSGARRPQQIATPVAIRSGAAFSLATHEGPRFTVQLDELPDHIKEERAKGKGMAPSKAEMKKEARRQVLFRIFATGPGQMIATWWQLIKSGQIFEPRYLFAGALILGGYVVAGYQGWTKGSLEDEFADQEKDLENCKEANAFSEGDSDSFTFAKLAQRVTGAETLGIALSSDEVLSGMVREHAATILQAPSRYDFLVDTSRNFKQRGWFAKVRETFEKDSELPSGAGRVLAFTAARPNVSNQAWAVLQDSRGQMVCGRGAMSLTWRQALALGLEPRLEAMIEGSARGWDGEEFAGKRTDLLSQTARLSGIDEHPDLGAEFDVDFASLQGGLQTCMYMQGDDEREISSISSGVRSISRRLAKDAKGLPRGTDGAAIPARVAAIYAADWPGVDYKDRKKRPDLSAAKVSQSTTILKDQGGDWILDKTAEVIARAITLPCLAVLDAEETGADATALGEVFGSPMPRALDCVVLDWRIRTGR